MSQLGVAWARVSTVWYRSPAVTVMRSLAASSAWRKAP